MRSCRRCRAVGSCRRRRLGDADGDECRRLRRTARAGGPARRRPAGRGPPARRRPRHSRAHGAEPLRPRRRPLAPQAARDRAGAAGGPTPARGRADRRRRVRDRLPRPAAAHPVAAGAARLHARRGGAGRRVPRPLTCASVQDRPARRR